MFTEENEHNDDLNELIGRFEASLNEDKSFNFDDVSLSKIIDYYIDNKILDKALQAAEFGISMYNYRSIFYLKKAEVFLELKREEEALELIDKALIFDALDFNAYALKAEAYVDLEEFDKALEVLQLALEKVDKKDKPYVWLEIANVYEEQDDFTKAFESFKSAILENPKNQEILNRIWFCVELSELYEESIELHKSVIDENPYSFMAWYNLGHAYMGLKLYEKAIDAFEYVIIINKEYEYAYKDAADAHRKLKEFDKAIELYKECLEVVNEDQDIYFALGQCYEAQDDYSTARNFYSKCVRLDPFYEVAFDRIGMCYAAEKKWNNAISAFKKAVKLSDNNIDFVLHYANALSKNDQFDQAYDCYTQALKQNHSLDTTYIEFALFLKDYELFSDAVKKLESAEEYIVSTTEMNICKAGIIVLSGRVQEGLSMIEQIFIFSDVKKSSIFALFPEFKGWEALHDIVDEND